MENKVKEFALRLENINNGFAARKQLLTGGVVPFYQLDEGIELKIWDCQVKDGLQLSEEISGGDSSRFIIALFLYQKGMVAEHCDQGLTIRSTSDIFLISEISACNLKLEEDGEATGITISVSRDWLRREMKRNKKLVTRRIFNDRMFYSGSMDQNERQQVERIIANTELAQFQFFHLKAAVHNLLTDLFRKFNQIPSKKLTAKPVEDAIETAKNVLLENLRTSLPELNKLAARLGKSESTLKRQFKKRYGVSMSAFYYAEKMRLAKELMDYNGIAAKETAKMIGYRNYSHFISTYTKYSGKGEA
jgi:AraC-like DNA-binding protein